MAEKHKISEYIDQISFKKKFGMGFPPDEVYEVICDLTSMYNEVLAESYQEVSELKEQLREKGMNPPQPEETPTMPDFTSDILSRITPLSEKEEGHADDIFIHSKAPNPVEFFQSLKEAANLEETRNPEPAVQPEDNNDISLEPNEDSKSEIEDTQVQVKDKPDMLEKDLQKLKRGELLEILLEQSKKVDALQSSVDALTQENTCLQEKLNDRKIKIDKAGTLAEATFLINGVLESAQAAAQQYLDNLQDIYDREETNCTKKEADTNVYVQNMLENAKKQCESMKKETEDKCSVLTFVTQEKCEAMKQETELFCKSKEEETLKKCQHMENATKLNCEAKEREVEERCSAMEIKAKLDAEKHWEQLTTRLEEFYKAHEGLRDLLSASGQIPRI